MSKKRKWELRHDMLAPKIWAKLPEQDRVLRQIQRSLDQRQSDYAAGEGSLLGKKELKAWRVYRKMLTQLNDFKPEVLQYFDDSEAALVKARVEEKRIQRNKIDKETRMRKAAETAKKQAEDNAQVAANNAHHAKQRTRIAAALGILASVGLIFAFLQYRVAKNALTKLQRVNESGALNLINAQKDILSLDYSSALLKIKRADGLGFLKEQVVLVYLEIAFWHNEVGHRDQAKNILDWVAILLNKSNIRSMLKKIPTDTVESRIALRETIKTFDAFAFQTCWERYYPVMMEVTGGTFTMGCDPRIEPGCNSKKKLHKATVSDFAIAKYETTWWQYHLFCTAVGQKYSPPNWGRQGNNPVVNTNWYDAVAYANWVSVQIGLPQAIVDGKNHQIKVRSKGYRLPTEAEWEYAAKEGKTRQSFLYSGSNTLDSVGWYHYNSNRRTQSVGRLKPNALGLYDMSGNVREWCWDWYGTYQENSPTDFAGPDAGIARVLRGGAWYYNGNKAYVSDRVHYAPSSRSNTIGFRISRAR